MAKSPVIFVRGETLNKSFCQDLLTVQLCLVWHDIMAKCIVYGSSVSFDRPFCQDLLSVAAFSCCHLTGLSAKISCLCSSDSFDTTLCHSLLSVAALCLLTGFPTRSLSVATLSRLRGISAKTCLCGSGSFDTTICQDLRFVTALSCLTSFAVKTCCLWATLPRLTVFSSKLVVFDNSVFFNRISFQTCL